MTRRAARSSFEAPGFIIWVAVCETNAAAQALCMELLEAGACRLPRMADGEIVTFIVYYLARAME
jgi:hypothetical protein